MGLLKRISYILFAIMLISCSTANRFNREIKRLDKVNGEKYWKANQKFFSYMKDSLKDTKHIYYNIATVYGYNTFDGWAATIFDEDNESIYRLYIDSKNKIKVDTPVSFESVFRSLDTIYVDKQIKSNSKYYLSEYFKDSIVIVDLLHYKDHLYEYELFTYDLFKRYSCDTIINLEKYNGIDSDYERLYRINLNEKSNNKSCYYKELSYYRKLFEEVHNK